MGGDFSLWCLQLGEEILADVVDAVGCLLFLCCGGPMAGEILFLSFGMLKESQMSL